MCVCVCVSVCVYIPTFVGMFTCEAMAAALGDEDPGVYTVYYNTILKPLAHVEDDKPSSYLVQPDTQEEGGDYG